MDTVLNVTVPVFGIILAGYLAGRAGILGALASDALNRFVYWIALPPVLFLGCARRALADFFNLDFMGAFLGAAMLLYGVGCLLGWLLHRESARVLAMQGLAASFSNTGYMGIPLFLTAFGPAYLPPVILATVLVSTVMIGFAIVFLEIATHFRHGLGPVALKVGRALVFNPLIVAPTLGVVWSVSTHAAPLPQSLTTFAELLGASAGPCALFAVGLFLASSPFEARWSELGWIVALKLLWHPFLVWLLIQSLFPLENEWATAALILAALPTGALPFVLAQQYDVYVRPTAAVILVSTVLSTLTLSVLLVVFQAHG